MPGHTRKRSNLRGRSGLEMASACSIRVRGVVQGVGFRPFVYRLARANTLAGWVLNGEEGVEIHLEGAEPSLDAFVRALRTQAPPAASISEIDVASENPSAWKGSRFASANVDTILPSASRQTLPFAMNACERSSIPMIRGTAIHTLTVRIAVRDIQLCSAFRMTAATQR